MRGAVKRMFGNTPSTENFPNLYLHRALNRANAAIIFLDFLQVGGKLKVLLDAEIDGSDTIDIDAKLGLVKKVELNRPQLLTQLSTR